MVWQKRGRIGLAVAVMTVLGACRQGGTEVQLPVDDSAPVATDQKRYVPEVSSDHGDYVRYTINVSYTNANATSVYLVPCSKVPRHPTISSSTSIQKSGHLIIALSAGQGREIYQLPKSNRVKASVVT